MWGGRGSGSGRAGGERGFVPFLRELGNAGEAGRGTQFVHGRSRMTIDLRILTTPERNTSGFNQTGRHCLHQALSAVRCSASRMVRRGGGGSLVGLVRVQGLPCAFFSERCHGIFA